MGASDGEFRASFKATVYAFAMTTDEAGSLTLRAGPAPFAIGLPKFLGKLARPQKDERFVRYSDEWVQKIQPNEPGRGTVASAFLLDSTLTRRSCLWLTE
jgi:hypothetical protein